MSVRRYIYRWYIGMTLYSIDPGTEQSAIVVVQADGRVQGGIHPNEKLLDSLYGGAHLVIEQVESFGMPVGAEVFATVFWAGRFAQRWDDFGGAGSTWSLLPRKAVKLALCGSLKAKDSNLRQALIDRYGGPSCVKKGGPLYGIKSHCWSALALAVTYQESQK